MFDSCVTVIITNMHLYICYVSFTYDSLHIYYIYAVCKWKCVHCLVWFRSAVMCNCFFIEGSHISNWILFVLIVCSTTVCVYFSSIIHQCLTDDMSNNRLVRAVLVLFSIECVYVLPVQRYKGYLHSPVKYRIIFHPEMTTAICPRVKISNAVHTSEI